MHKTFSFQLGQLPKLLTHRSRWPSALVSACLLVCHTLVQRRATCYAKATFDKLVRLTSRSLARGSRRAHLLILHSNSPPQRQTGHAPCQLPLTIQAGIVWRAVRKPHLPACETYSVHQPGTKEHDPVLNCSTLRTLYVDTSVHAKTLHRIRHPGYDTRD
jgi:hypothetical protein